MNTDPNRLERRGAQRFELHLPLAIHFDGRTVPGFTQDLSGRGIFFYAETALPQGAVVELTFTMPSEITLGENMPVRCRGRVLRSSTSPGVQRNGVAVVLDSYEYLPATEPNAQFVRVSAVNAITSGPLTR
jgi:PilZ domain